MPRIYVKKETRTGEVDEDAIKSAIKEVSNRTLSIRESAAKYGIKSTTFESRLANYKRDATDHIPARVFTS